MAIDLNDLATAIGQLVLRFRLRRWTAAQWVANNEVLLSSEMGLESDTGKIKIGDGVTGWNALDYMKAGTPIGVANQGDGIDIDVTNPDVPIISSTVGAIALSGRVATYSALPGGLTSGDAGKAYLVDADQLVYVWSGTAWPTTGNGLAVTGSGSGALSTVTYNSSTAISSLTLNASTEGNIDWYNTQLGSARNAWRFVKAFGVPGSSAAVSGWGFTSITYSTREGVITSGTIPNGSFASYTANTGFQLTIRLAKGPNVVRIYTSNASPYSVSASIQGSTSTATSGSISVVNANQVAKLSFDCREEGQIAFVECIKLSSTGNMALSIVTLGTT